MKRGIIAAAVLSCASASLAENIIAEVDVVVAGGTSYGVAAAVEAARSGRSVFLVAPRAALGEDLAGTLRLLPADEATLPKELRERMYAPNPEVARTFDPAGPLFTAFMGLILPAFLLKSIVSFTVLLLIIPVRLP